MTAAGLPVHRLVDGDPTDPVLVLVHGMEATWQSWQRFTARLESGWRVYAPEMPWQTGSRYRWGAHGTSGAWLAEVLAEILAALDTPPTVLIGHSFGANAILEVLAGSPAVRRVVPTPRAAVLVAPFYRPPDLEVGWGMFEETRKGFEHVIGQGLATWLGRRGVAVEPGVLEAMLAKLIGRIGPLAFTSWFEHFVASGDLDLGAVAVPTLVLAGTADPCLAGGRAEAFAAAMPAATVLLDETYDHFCHIRQAARVAGQVARFLPGAPAHRPDGGANDERHDRGGEPGHVGDPAAALRGRQHPHLDRLQALHVPR